MHMLAVAGDDQFVFDCLPFGEGDQRRIAVHAQQNAGPGNRVLQSLPPRRWGTALTASCEGLDNTASR